MDVEQETKGSWRRCRWACENGGPSDVANVPHLRELITDLDPQLYQMCT